MLRERAHAARRRLQHRETLTTIMMHASTSPTTMPQRKSTAFITAAMLTTTKYSCRNISDLTATQQQFPQPFPLPPRPVGPNRNAKGCSAVSVCLR